MLKRFLKMGNKLGRRRPLVDEQFTKPQGLYVHKDLDHKKLRKLILAGHLAPCYVGSEEVLSELEECPICFLYYPSLNRSKCCSKGMCTECFLQMKAPQIARPTQCPFCKTPSYCVEYKGAKTIEEKGREQAEEQKVIEAKIRIRLEEAEQEQERVRRREQDILEGRIPLPPPPPPPAAGDPLPDLPLVPSTWLSAHNTSGSSLLARQQRSSDSDSEMRLSRLFVDVDSLYSGANFAETGSQSEHGSSSSTLGDGVVGRGASPQGALSSDRPPSGWSMFGTVGRPPLGRADASRGSGSRSLFRTETVRAIEADSLWFRSGVSGEPTPSAADTAYALATATPGFLTRSAISPPHPHEGVPFGSPMSTDGSISTPFSHFQRSVGSTPFPRWEEGPEFDMDLEEIMIMEAIWQSLRLGEGSNGGEVGSGVASMSGQMNALDGAAQRAVGARSTGGLAGAIAALAERQAESSSRLSFPASRSPSLTAEEAGPSTESRESSSNIEQPSFSRSRGGTDLSEGNLAAGAEAQIAADLCGAGSGGEPVLSTLRQQDVGPSSDEVPGVVPGKGELLSEGRLGVESGAVSCSSCSTVTATAPSFKASTSEVTTTEPGIEREIREQKSIGVGLPGVNLQGATTSLGVFKGLENVAEDGGVKAVPESYEDQIMYAIALSLAESQEGSDGRR